MVRVTNPLIATEVRAASPAQKEYTLQDGNGLYLLVNLDSGAVYRYQDGIWQHLPDTVLRRTLVAIFAAHDTPHNPKGIDAAIESLLIMVPLFPGSQPALVAFVNGGPGSTFHY